MKSTKSLRIAAVIATSAALTLGIAGASFAAPNTPQPGIVVAQDVTSTLTATPSAPGAIRVSTAPKTSVTLAAKSRSKTTGKPITKRTDAKGSVVFTGLTPGASYTVITASAATTVTVVGAPGDARNLTVTTTNASDALDLTWTHKDNATQGKVRYRVEAIPQDKSFDPITDIVTKTSARVSGLDSNAIYTFRVTPFNEVGEGKATSARMNRSLAEITGREGELLEVEAETAPQVSSPQAATPVVEPITEPAPAPNSGSSPQPAAPRTKTIYVCPDGSSENGAACTKTMGYTYSTRDYTYTYGKTGTQLVWSRCSSGYTDDQGQFHWVEQPHDCQVTQDVFGDIKDPTPAGWSDTGSNWSKKDDAPAGWSDDGSQYVQSADKVAREVPA